ncbi:MAG: S8 family serine peptidase [Vicinamibacteria bacterium]|jgi:subtilisin family serine protease|nr:S8 family serine peptidase [Vicinamibacteria bacterium]
MRVYRKWGLFIGVVAWSCGLSCSRASIVGEDVRAAVRAGGRARVVVALREPLVNATSAAERERAIAVLSSEVLAQLTPGDFQLTAQFRSVSALAGHLTANGLDVLATHPEVVRIDLDVPVHATLAESTRVIGADQAHNLQHTGRGVAVAVLDTGVQGDHPDLKDHVVNEQCYCTRSDNSGCCPNGSTQQSGAGAARDDNGHGTNVAGIITAPLGVAPEAEIVALKVLAQDGSAASVSQIITGMDYILTQRPEVKVVNLSLATTQLFEGPCDNAAAYTIAFASAINGLRQRGALTFVSSGNDGSATKVGAPGCVSTAITVGAVYDADFGPLSFGCVDATTAADKVACFSNGGINVDVLAPGGAITSSGLNSGQSTYVGTSQAAPHAAGVAALLLGAKPGLTPDQIEAAMKSTGRAIVDGRNGQTYPRVDALAALQAVLAP